MVAVPTGTGRDLRLGPDIIGTKVGVANDRRANNRAAAVLKIELHVSGVAIVEIATHECRELVGGFAGGDLGTCGAGRNIEILIDLIWCAEIAGGGTRVVISAEIPVTGVGRIGSIGIVGDSGDARDYANRRTRWFPTS